jgi:hypothetical protein
MRTISTKAKIAAGMSLTSFLLLAACWFSLGVYADREWGELYVFPKYRLSFKFYFYAPIGEANTPMSSLTLAQQQAELDFEEFVERGYENRW